MARLVVYGSNKRDIELLIMAARLPVILIQTRPPNAAAERLVDQLVGELIGSPGFDLVLVEPLSSLSTEATDRLTLEALQGDTVILDWNSVEEVLQSWGDLGLSGSRSPHALDRDPVQVPAGQRRVYLIDLRVAGSVPVILSTLVQIQAGQQVKTVQLGVLGERGASRPSLVEPRSQQGQLLGGLDAKRQARSVGDDLKSESLPVSQASDGDETSRILGHPSHQASKNKLDLDALVDELDQSDL